MIKQLPSYICSSPSYPVDLTKESILIEDKEDGISTDFIVGEIAMHIQPDSVRMYGGNLKSAQFRRLLRATIAHSLGEGTHSIQFIMSAAKDWIESFRSTRGEYVFSDENTKIFEEIISEIRFKTDSSHSPWKTCRVISQNKPFILFENQAVSYTLPRGVKNYVLWQLGHGDWQQLTFVDGIPQPQTYQRVRGISGAIKEFAELTQLSHAEADKAWRLGTLPEFGGMNGARVDCSQQKKLAAKKFIQQSIPLLLNETDAYSGRAKKIVLSGGGAKDEFILDVLRKEISAVGKYDFIRINEIPTMENQDPSYTCLRGMLNYPDIIKVPGNTLAVDLGNSFLKSVVQL